MGFRSVTSNYDASFTQSSLLAAAPSGAQTGDLELIVFNSATIAPASAPTHTTPAGWTLIDSVIYLNWAGGANSRASLYYRIAPSTPTDITMDASAASAISTIRAAYSGMDTSGPYGQVTSKIATSTPSETMDSITTTRDNALVVGVIVQTQTTTRTSVDGLPKRLDVNGLLLTDFVQSPAGTTGVKTWTADGIYDYFSHVIEFWPAPPAPAVTASIAWFVA